VRLDGTGLWGNRMSYTLGLTYQLAGDTTLRAYAAHGFSIPMLAQDTGIQRVNTVQAGVETGRVPFLWLKGTYFFNTLRNAESSGPLETVTGTDQDLQGVELEARTLPVYGLSLSGGYTYLHAEDEATGKQLRVTPSRPSPPRSTSSP
jgi:vitamin B12 transporter